MALRVFAQFCEIPEKTASVDGIFSKFRVIHQLVDVVIARLMVFVELVELFVGKFRRIFRHCVCVGEVHVVHIGVGCVRCYVELRIYSKEFLKFIIHRKNAADNDS